ncbi:hypothetical protein Tco_0115593 [Tanacetum coccineum]
MSSLQSTDGGMNGEAGSGSSGDDGNGNDVGNRCGYMVGGKCRDDGGVVVVVTGTCVVCQPPSAQMQSVSLQAVRIQGSIQLQRRVSGARWLLLLQYILLVPQRAPHPSSLHSPSINRINSSMISSSRSPLTSRSSVSCD